MATSTDGVPHVTRLLTSTMMAFGKQPKRLPTAPINTNTRTTAMRDLKDSRKVDPAPQQVSNTTIEF
jgi:hypothetical protein